MIMPIARSISGYDKISLNVLLNKIEQIPATIAEIAELISNGKTDANSLFGKSPDRYRIE